jgi:gluconate 2-dehydrogenase gamma chain
MAGCASLQPRQLLTLDELTLVEAIADQVIPRPGPRRGTPGGLFIEQQLRGRYARFLPAYQEGLRRVDESSRRLHGRRFIDLTVDTQTALLAALERNQGPDGIWPALPRGSAEFFRLVADHCLQGYYGSPRHGGNRDGASWRMIGVPYPQVVGRILP